jgi:hypothetical protein
VNVTDVPAHTGFDDAPMLTLAVTLIFTTMLIVPEVAGLPVTHVAFEVITT